MQKDFIKQWLLLNEKTQKSFQKVNALHADSMKQLTQLQMDMVTSCLEGSMGKNQKMAEIKSIAEFFELQSNFYKEWSEHVLSGAQDSFKVAMDSKQAMNDLLSEALNDQSGDNKEAVKPVVNKKQAVRRAPAKAKPAAKKIGDTPKTASRPAVKKAVRKPAVKKEASKPAVKKEASKPVVKEAVSKPAVKKAASSPVVKKAVSKPVVKETVSQPVRKQTIAKSVVKKTVDKPLTSEDVVKKD